MNEYTNNGIMYTWELAGSNGASFILFPNSDHTPEQIQAAKQELRDSRDVVALRVANDSDLDDQFITAIFRVPALKHLRWYEIDQDEKTVRKERLKGTSPFDYVQNIVLPNIEATKQRYIEKYGNKIEQVN